MNDLTLVDTDILIDVGRSLPDAVDWVYRKHRPSELAVSAITQMELMIGCESLAELRKLDRFLKQFLILNVNPAITDRAIRLLRTYRLSHGLLIADGLIAATALVLKMPLATNNQRDFRFIKGLRVIEYP